MMSKVSVLLTFSLFTLSNSLFFGCCGAPQIQTCCQSTSWAYAPPRIIGYERIPLYAKVPVAAPPQYPPPPPPNYPPPPPPPMPQYNAPYEVAPMSGSTFGSLPGSTLGSFSSPGSGGFSGTSQGSFSGSAPGTFPGSPQGSFSGSSLGHLSPSGTYTEPPGSSFISASRASNQIPQIIKLPSSDGYSEGDTIIIETDDHRLKRYNVMPPPPPPPQAPIEYTQPQQQQVAGSNYLPQQSQLINGGQVENGVEVTLDQINSNQLPVSNYGAQSLQSSAVASAASGFESSGLIAPAARRLRKFKN